ncbi:28001_t:CDS:1, partial [Dentiscutata erythropus]
KELSGKPYGLIKRFVFFEGSSEKSFKERIKDPLEKSLVKRIEDLESKIEQL